MKGTLIFLIVALMSLTTYSLNKPVETYGAFMSMKKT